MLSVVPRSQLWVCPVLQIRSSEKDIYSTEASQPIELDSLCIHLSLELSACSQHLCSILAFSALGWSPIPLFVCFLVHPVEIFPWSLTWSAFIVPLVPPLQTWLALFFCGCPEVVMNAIVSYGTCVLGDTGISPSLESALLPLLPAGLCPPALWDASGFPENSGMWDSGQQAAGSRKRKKNWSQTLGSTISLAIDYASWSLDLSLGKRKSLFHMGPKWGLELTGKSQIQTTGANTSINPGQELIRMVRIGWNWKFTSLFRDLLLSSVECKLYLTTSTNLKRFYVDFLNG